MANAWTTLDDCRTGHGTSSNDWETASDRGDTLNLGMSADWTTRIRVNLNNYNNISKITISLTTTNSSSMNRSATVYYYFSSTNYAPDYAYNRFNSSNYYFNITKNSTHSNVTLYGYTGTETYLYMTCLDGSAELRANGASYPTVNIIYDASTPEPGPDEPEGYESAPFVNGYISNYPQYTTGSAYMYFDDTSVTGNSSESVRLTYKASDYVNIYIVIYNSSNRIVSVSESGDDYITLPSNAGNYYAVLVGEYKFGYGFFRSSGVCNVTVIGNSKPYNLQVTFTPSSGLPNQTTNVTIGLSASDSDGDTLSYRYSTGTDFSNASSISNGDVKSLTAGTTYYFWAYDGKEYIRTSKTFETLNFSINLNDQPTQKDNSYYPSSTGLVKSFLSLTANATYNGNPVYNANYSWYYKTGTDIDTSPSVGSSETTISGYYSSTITNFDLGNYYPGIAGRAYKIGVKCTYNGATVSAETPVYVYPSSLNEITTYSYNNKNSTSSYANTNSEDYDDNIYLRIKYPTNTYRQYPKISQIHIKFANSPSEGQLENNSNYVTFFSDSFLGSTTSNTTGEGSEENFTISLDNSITGSSLPRNEYFKIQIELIDSSGQSNITNLDEVFYRISKPTFGDTNIGSNRPQTIAVNQLDSSWSWQLAFSSGSMYNLKTYPLTDEGLKQQAIETIKQLEIQLQTLDGSTVSKQIVFTDSNITANYGNATVYLTIAAAELQNLLSDYTSLNTSLEGTLILALEDPFENIATLSTIRFPNSILDDNVVFSFGTPPVLPDYTEPNPLYTLKPIYQYSTPVSGSFYTNLDTSNIETKNMVNYGDKLEFVFPKATDANGNDDGTSHGDILGYRIKIVRSDDRESIQSVSDDNFSILSEIPFSNGNISYDSSTENYTYQHSVNNYTTSKFIRLGICAYDSTFLESNLIVFPYIIVAGRISPSSLSITSHKVNTNEDGTSYDFRINFSDIGGNLFNNTGYHYSDYPNLERNISGNVNDSRDVKFFIAYRNDATSDFTTSEQLSFKTDKDSSSSINYDPSLSYSNLLTKTIRIEGLTFSQSIIDPAQKAYFKIIAYVQTGFNDLGEKVYQISESPIYILYPSTPTVSYRRNSVGINTSDLDGYIFRIAFAGGDRHLVRIDSVQVGSDNTAPYILIDLNAAIPLITGIEISDED